MKEFFLICIEILTKNYKTIILGVKTTLLVAILGTVFGFIIGLFVGGIKAIKLDENANSVVKFFKKVIDIIITIYIEVFRGTPMMVQAVFLYYAFLPVFNWSHLTAAIFVISINTGSYMSEIVRSGIQAVDKGQVEAARSLGMSNFQTMMSIVLPQAIVNAFPSIGNELIVNIKDSSVLMIISITEIMFQAKSIAGANYRFIETYFIIALVYLSLTLISSFILRIIEKKINNTSSSYPQSISLPNNMKTRKDA